MTEAEPESDASGDDAVATIDQATFRTVLGHFATGITVITALLDGEPVGLAANSFTSVSLDPPLVLFCAAKSSTTWPSIQKAGVFCVNILSDTQEDVSRLFAAKGADRFQALGYHSAATGAPVLHDALAYIDCRIEGEHDAGDHIIVVGRVLALELQHEGRPLLFFRGGYGRFGV